MVRRMLLALCAGALPFPGLALSPDDAVALVRATLENSGRAGTEVIAPTRPLPDCAGRLSVEPVGASASTVTLRCDMPAWQRALRLRGAETAIRRADTTTTESSTILAVVLARPLARDTLLTAADLTLAPVPALGPESIFVRTQDLLGRRLSRALGAGKPILARHLHPDWQVLKDMPVTILTELDGIRVAMAGQARADAAMGEPVEVVNLSSGKTVVARVVGRDIVQVALKPFAGQP